VSAPLTATELRRVASRLATRGFTVKLYPGWETRGRPGTFGPLAGFLWHHTGGSSQSDDYLYFLFISGRASEGIPGPLCQWAVRANGEIWLGALGRANHAGRGSSSTLSKMRNSAAPYTSEIGPGPDDTDGNAIAYGVEIMYTGGQPMTTAQYRASIALAAELDREMGWTAQRDVGHREWSGRKVDPGGHKMYTMRQDTRDALLGGAEEDDLLPDEREALFAIRSALFSPIPRTTGAGGADAPRDMWASIQKFAYNARENAFAALSQSKDNGTKLADVDAKVDAIQTVDVEALARAILAGLPPSNITLTDVDAVVRSALADIQIGFGASNPQ
jgi:hypothetical protein